MGTVDAGSQRGVLEELNRLDRELAMVQEQRAEIQVRLDEVQESLRRHEDDAASAEALLEARRPQVKERVRGLYRLHRRGLARLIFGAEDPSELRRRSTYLLAILDADLSRMDQYAQAIADRSSAREALEKDVLSLKALRAEVQLREAEIREARARRLTMLENIRSRPGLGRQAVAAYGQAGRDLGSRLDTLGGGSAAVTQQARLINPERGMRDAFGRLPWPATGSLVRRFGTYTDPGTNSRADSLGILIQAEYGTPIRAVFDGTVKLVDLVAGYGQTVAIAHGPYTTVYYHAGGIEVQRGQVVRQGDVIGVVGNSGYTDGRGSVLGFELRYNGEPQDPLPWLGQR